MGSWALARISIFILLIPQSLWGIGTAGAVVQSALDPQEKLALETMYCNAWYTSSGDPCSDGWQGITCDGGSPLQHITGINLSTSGIAASTFLSGVVKLPFLSSLSLSGCDLSGPIPVALSSLSYLQSIDLSNNSFTGPIPPEFGKLSALQSLSLEHNQLTGNVPKELCQATDLRILMLGDNGLGPFIPDCLGGLLNLTVISIFSNHLEGSIPTSLGQLQALSELILSNNSLTGGIPAGITSLSNLTKLHLSGNLLEGALPDNLYRLVKLRELHLDSNKFSGRIPESLSSVKTLQKLRLFDNQLSGGIPEDIGNLTELTVLFLQANQLSGPLPVSLGSLEKLQQLHLQGNEFNGTLSGAVLENLTSLRSIYVQFNQLEGSIPLETLWLSKLENISLGFNQIGGVIPRPEDTNRRFQLPALTYVSFCNNSLSGSIPTDVGKLGNLRFIDISNNQLNGSIPGEFLDLLDSGSVQGNLVFNNFDPISDRNEPCSSLLSTSLSRICQHAGQFTELAVNVGGESFSSRFDASLRYVGDNSFQDRLGYFMSNASGEPFAPWIMTLQGVVDGLPILSSTSGAPPPGHQVEWNLFQTSRVGADNIMYTVWSLKPGHYMLELSFIELDPDVYRAGQRVFSVYVQGVLRNSSVDIFKTTGGIGKPMVLVLSVFTTDGRIKVELVGRGSWPLTEEHMMAYRGPTLSGLRIYQPRDSRRGVVLAAVGVAAGCGGLIALSVTFWLCLLLLRRRKWKRKRLTAFQDWNKVGLMWFRLADLEAATNNFRETNLIGEGGFGKVYKGVLPNGATVAVKQLIIPNRNSMECLHNELQVISTVRHKNLVSLIGCCLELDCPIIVCQYMPNGNLNDALFKGSTVSLSWATRFKIALEIASGLHYLHEGSVHKIVHRDVKPANILLDSTFSAHITDFGMARLLGEQELEVITGVMGTRGYMSPEYALLGQLSEKVDVFGFGVVVLEMVTGRKGAQPSLTTTNPIPLNSWAWQMFAAGNFVEMVDKKLNKDYALDEFMTMLKVAIWCTEYDPNLRPSMAQVIHMLTRKVPIPPIPLHRKIPLDEDIHRLSLFAKSTGNLQSPALNENNSFPFPGNVCPSPASDCPLLHVSNDVPSPSSPDPSYYTLPSSSGPSLYTLPSSSDLPHHRFTESHGEQGGSPSILRSNSWQWESGYSGYRSSDLSVILGR